MRVIKINPDASLWAVVRKGEPAGAHSIHWQILAMTVNPTAPVVARPLWVGSRVSCFKYCRDARRRHNWNSTQLVVTRLLPIADNYRFKEALPKMYDIFFTELPQT